MCDFSCISANFIVSLRKIKSINNKIQVCMKKLFSLVIGMIAMLFASCEENVPENTSENMENGHEYVDLGLSVKWATCNVGANTP